MVVRLVMVQAWIGVTVARMDRKAQIWERASGRICRAATSELWGLREKKEHNHLEYSSLGHLVHGRWRHWFGKEGAKQATHGISRWKWPALWFIWKFLLHPWHCDLGERVDRHWLSQLSLYKELFPGQHPIAPCTYLWSGWDPGRLPGTSIVFPNQVQAI